MLTNPAARSWLLRLYPADWRARYGEEFAALLEDCPPSFIGLFDVLLGALDAHIAPLDANGRILRMLHQSRRSAIVVFCAYIAFVLAGISYNQTIEDDLRALNSAHPDVALAYHIVFFVAPLSLLAVLAGGLPIALVALRHALTGRRRDILALFAVPPLALALWLGWTAVIVRVIAPAHPNMTIHETFGLAVFVSWSGLFVLAAIASTAAVTIAVSRSEVSPQLYRFALGPGVAAVVTMAVMLGGVVAWGLLMRADDPAYLNGTSGPFGLSVVTHWLIVVSVMALATLVAAIALVRAYRAPADGAFAGAATSSG